ncbi:MAG: hypothetical protein APR63_09345 [Desulfuromonas sp. SDB]|nr:MAG: hypothetical protein APR63_09345 [Desulfuromonas sp. SDB]
MSDEEIIKKIKNIHPQFQDITPKIKEVVYKPDKHLAGKSKIYRDKAKPRRIKIFTFIKKIRLNQQIEFEKILRVSVDSQGNIIKTVFSK